MNSKSCPPSLISRCPMRKQFLVLAVLSICILPLAAQEPLAGRWLEERAATWQRERPWLVGCNFIPSTAINQLEMWQADTFDSATIDRELGWAEGLGMNCVRVYLHDLAWHADADGFKKRIGNYLDIAAKHKIRTIF